MENQLLDTLNKLIKAEWQKCKLEPMMALWEQISITFNRNTTYFIQENEFENVSHKISAILPQPQCVRRAVILANPHFSPGLCIQGLPHRCCRFHANGQTPFSQRVVKQCQIEFTTNIGRMLETDSPINTLRAGTIWLILCRQHFQISFLEKKICNLLSYGYILCYKEIQMCLISYYQGSFWAWGSANGGQCYNVTSPLIDWAQTQNDPWLCIVEMLTTKKINNE